MKLREIFRYEIEYRLRSGSTWAYAGILFLVAIWMFLATADEGGFNNAPERLAGGSVLPGMFGMLVTAALFGGAAVRDVQVGMDPLLFTSPLRKTEYLGGRFLGALAVNAVVLVAIPLGLLAATGLLAQFDSDPLGPFRIGAYLQPYFLFLLPNLVVVGAILFAIGMLARQVVLVYLGAIGVFIGYVVALNYAGQIESPILAGLVDPLGLVTLEEVTRYWTEAERNTRLIGLPATLAWNRAFWLVVAAAVLALLHRTFRFAHPDGGGRLRMGRRTVVAPQSERARPVEVPRVAGSFGFRTAVRQTLAVAGNSLAEVAASRWFVVVLLACVGLPLLWGWNVGDTVFDTSTWPVTLLVTEEVLAGRSLLLFFVLILVYAGELVWKDREVGVAEIADAAPVPDGVALLGRFLALFAMIVMFQAASMVGGMLIQALQGYYDFEIGLYLRVVFGLMLAGYVLLSSAISRYSSCRTTRHASASVSRPGRPRRDPRTRRQWSIAGGFATRTSSRSTRSSVRPPTRSRSRPACCVGAGRRTGDATSTTRRRRRSRSAARSPPRNTRCSRTGGTTSRSGSSTIRPTTPTWTGWSAA